MRGTGAPSGSGYTKIYSTYGAFAAVKADGAITAWSLYLIGCRGKSSNIQITPHRDCSVSLFIQLIVPLPPLKPMAQSRRGVIQILDFKGSKGTIS
jgi:hypothetical protein